ncbi:hypothetical protein niasHT_000968 [Heterodera trifolii]|uniref:Uncharacterized protein n=1 Tax=Heterodera trifolii TaxID=157864 RepID=A0ABD2M4E1_9BILA
MPFFATPLPIVVATVLISFAAFLPHFCGALKCAMGATGIGPADPFGIYECSEKSSIYCFKGNCTAVSTNEHYFSLGCTYTNIEKESADLMMANHIKPNSKAADWTCAVQFGKRDQPVPFPVPGENKSTPAGPGDAADDGTNVLAPMAFILPLVFVAYFCVLPIF